MNLVISTNMKTDHELAAKGYKFLGAAEFEEHGEVHVFQMQPLEDSQREAPTPA